jgi:hypothetical protein
MYLLKQATAQRVALFLGATGLTPNADVSKNGGSFSAPSNTVVEISNGWYSLDFDAGDTGILGPLALHLDAGTPADFVFQVYDEIDVNVIDWQGNPPGGLDSGNVPAHLVTAAGGSINGAALNADVVAKIFGGAALTESYAADGAAATPAQLLYALLSVLSEFAIAGTTITCKKLDGTTTSMTFTLNSATAPTSRTRAT